MIRYCVVVIVLILASIQPLIARSLSSPGFRIQLDDNTGWPSQITSMQPKPLELLIPTTPFVFYIKDMSSGNSVDLSRAIVTEETRQSVTYTLQPENPDWNGKLSGQIKYTLTQDTLRVTAKIIAVQDISGEHMIKFAFGFKPDAFEREWFPAVPHDIALVPHANGYRSDYPWVYGLEILSSKHGEKNLYIGGLPKNDVEKKSDIPWSGGLTVPLGVGERKDRLLAFARFDTGLPALFATESVGARGTFPIMLRFPKQLKTGDEFQFDLSFKSFIRPKNNYTQVMSWFLDNGYSTNPSTTEAVGRNTDTVGPRALAGGLNGWGPTDYDQPAGYVHPFERQMVEDGMNQTWWISAHSEIDENYPVDDRLYYDECQRPTTAAKVRTEIQRQIKLGVGVLMYRRNWLIWENCQNDRPPYKYWCLNYEKPVEERAIETKVLNEQTRKALGVDKLHKVMGDMNIPALQDWVVNQMMAELAYYQPSGQWWDMGDSGQGGSITLMKRIRDKASQLYPNMRFFGNEKYAGMDGLHCDALTIEGYEIGGKSERVFQCAKAYGRPIFNLVYTIYYQHPQMWTSKYNYYSGIVTANDVKFFAMRYRTKNLLASLDTPVISAKQTDWRDGAKTTLVTAKDIKADGAWHTLVIPLAGKLKGIPETTALAIGHADKMEIKAEKAYITTLLIDLPSAQSGDVRLDVDSFGFYLDIPEKVKSTLIPPKGSQGNELAYDNMDNLTNWPSAQPMRFEPGVASFVVRKGEPGKSWIKSDMSMFNRALMRGLGLGAFPGLGPAEPEMPLLKALYDFTSTGVRLVPVAEPLTVRSLDEKSVIASGWVGYARFQAAAYNLTKKPTICSLTFDIAALKDAYHFSGRLTPDQLTIFNSVTGSRHALGAKWIGIGSNRINLKCSLGPNELLLIKAH